MPAARFTNLLIVVAVGLFAPLALGFFPRLRLPAIVLEIVIGPSGLDWVKPDLPVSILALVGLAFLLFLSGLEIDVERLRGRILKLTGAGFALSFAIAIILGVGLKAGGFVKSPLFVAIVLVSSSLGVIVPLLKDSNNASSSFGQLVIAAASIAEFGALILLSFVLLGQGLDQHRRHADPARHVRAGRSAGRRRDRRCRAFHQPVTRPPASPGHDRADPCSCGVRAADRVHRTCRPGRASDDPRSVCGWRTAVDDRPRRDDPSAVSPEARGGRVRRVHPRVLCHERSAF